jgi:hypothetical protein
MEDSFKQKVGFGYIKWRIVSSNGDALNWPSMSKSKFSHQ